MSRWWWSHANGLFSPSCPVSGMSKHRRLADNDRKNFLGRWNPCSGVFMTAVALGTCGATFAFSWASALIEMPLQAFPFGLEAEKLVQKRKKRCLEAAMEKQLPLRLRSVAWRP